MWSPGLTFVALVLVSFAAGCGLQRGASQGATEAQVPAVGTTLHARTIGSGAPVLVLHGGPDFDQGYLLPELDRLAHTARLIYYDQRGRGRSAANVHPEDVTLASELDDIDRIRAYFGLGEVTLLGHSWGAVLALEYAHRRPDNVSRLILMNPAPVSTRDLAAARQQYLDRLGAEGERQRALVASADYQRGDPETVAARYRIHFRPSLTRPQHYERMMARMRAGFLRQGREGILKARAIEARLMRETWELAGYDLFPKIEALRMPTLVVVGSDDFMNASARRLAEGIPGATLVAIESCGHFAYLECPAQVDRAFQSFMRRGR